MSKNYVQPGNAITVVAPTGGTVSSNGYLLGNMFGVAATTEVEADPVVLDLVGVFTLPKVAAQAWTVGVPLYWDNTAKLVTTVTTNNKHIGGAVAPADNPSGFGLVRLNGTITA